MAAQIWVSTLKNKKGKTSLSQLSFGEPNIHDIKPMSVFDVYWQRCSFLTGTGQTHLLKSTNNIIHKAFRQKSVCWLSQHPASKTFDYMYMHESSYISSLRLHFYPLRIGMKLRHKKRSQTNHKNVGGYRKIKCRMHALAQQMWKNEIRHSKNNRMYKQKACPWGVMSEY